MYMTEGQPKPNPDAASLAASIMGQRNRGIPKRVSEEERAKRRARMVALNAQREERRKALKQAEFPAVVSDSKTAGNQQKPESSKKAK
jgi:hypothetical protein